MIDNMGLSDKYKAKLKDYHSNEKKAMTAVMVDYLEKDYPDEM